MKGQIIDVHPEGKLTFRACVLRVIGGEEELADVVCLNTGEKRSVHYWECSEPLIENIFDLESGE